MFKLLRCYLSGLHDYGVGCEPGSIFLRCVHCGRRSSGWNVDARQLASQPAARPVPAVAAVSAPLPAASAPFGRQSARIRAVAMVASPGRVIPFERTVAQ